MESALIGTVGVLIGILFTELIRRRNRIENYSQKIFEKRLEILEELYRRVCVCGEIGHEVTTNTKATSEDRYDLINATIIDMTEWCDEKGLYLNEEISLHCATLLMGIEDVLDIENEAEREVAIKSFNTQLKYAKEIIKKESGILDINKSFASMIKAKYSSPIIEYYRFQKKAMIKANKKKDVGR